MPDSGILQKRAFLKSLDARPALKFPKISVIDQARKGKSNLSLT